jgi:polyphenol oxidase
LSSHLLWSIAPDRMNGLFCTRELTADSDGGPRSIASKLLDLMPGKRIFCLTQIHSDRIVRAEDVSPDEYPEADGIISRDPSDVLCIRTADCVPVLLEAHDGSVIGAVHAGWRGLAQKIVFQAVLRMQSAGAEKIHAAIGPSIGPCCYQVGMDVIRELEAEPVRRIDGTLAVDLTDIAIEQAKKAGIPRERIHVKRSCTCCNPETLFSFRRDKEAAGRNISIIGGESWSLPGLRAE